MRSWLLSSICVLFISVVDSKIGGHNGWTVYQYFLCTCVFGIFLNTAWRR